MHHIRSIRKRTYKLEDPTFLKMMDLRNRRQIPVCKLCHMEKIHNGKYEGAPLKSMVPKKELTTHLYDNSIVHLESFIKPGIVYGAKTLEEKG
jgi:hypothetical protein